MVHQLSGQPREAILELDIEKLNSGNVVENIIAKIDTLYLKDVHCSAYEAYEKSEKYTRPSHMSIGDYIIEFEKLYTKIKNFDMTLPDGVLAYRFLNSANISTHYKELARGPLELKYDNMKQQLKKIFGNPKIFVSDTKSELYIKVESPDDTYPTYYQKGNLNRGLYRGRFNKANSFRNSNVGSYNRNFNRKSRKTYSVNKDGEITRCNVCGSIYHSKKSCLDSYAYQQNPKHDQEVRIALHEDSVKTLIEVFKSLSKAVLDSLQFIMAQLLFRNTFSKWLKFS